MRALRSLLRVARERPLEAVAVGCGVAIAGAGTVAWHSAKKEASKPAKLTVLADKAAPPIAAPSAGGMQTADKLAKAVDKRLERVDELLKQAPLDEESLLAGLHAAQKAVRKLHLSGHTSPRSHALRMREAIDVAKPSATAPFRFYLTALEIQLEGWVTNSVVESRAHLDAMIARIEATLDAAGAHSLHLPSSHDCVTTALRYLYYATVDACITTADAAAVPAGEVEYVVARTGRLLRRLFSALERHTQTDDAVNVARDIANLYLGDVRGLARLRQVLPTLSARTLVRQARHAQSYAAQMWDRISGLAGDVYSISQEQLVDRLQKSDPPYTVATVQSPTFPLGALVGVRDALHENGTRAMEVLVVFRGSEGASFQDWRVNLSAAAAELSDDIIINALVHATSTGKDGTEKRGTKQDGHQEESPAWLRSTGTKAAAVGDDSWSAGVHAGFCARTLHVLPPIVQFIEAQLQDRKAKFGSRPELWITTAGHSQGGALAHLTAVALERLYRPRRAVRAVTFATPGTFKNTTEAVHARNLLGVRHASVILDTDPVPIACRTFGFAPPIVQTTLPAGLGPLQLVSAHNMAQYRKALEDTPAPGLSHPDDICVDGDDVGAWRWCAAWLQAVAKTAVPQVSA